MTLLSQSVIDRLQQQHRFGKDLDKQEAVAKIYDPCGPATWYLLNQDPENPDRLLAIVREYILEIKEVSLIELEAYRGRPLGLPLDRDPYFLSMPARGVWEELQKGRHV